MNVLHGFFQHEGSGWILPGLIRVSQALQERALSGKVPESLYKGFRRLRGTRARGFGVKGVLVC